MSQRPPIRGIVLRKESSRYDKADLIVQATAEEVAAITIGDNLAFAKQDDGKPTIDQDMLLYDAQGRVVARIDDIVISRDRIDVTTFNDPSPRFMEGHRSMRITAYGVGDVRLSAFARR